MEVPNSKLNMKSMIKFLLFTVIVFVFTSNVFSQVPNYVPTNGLVGYWPFNGNANDESGNGNNGLTGSGVALTTDRFLISNSAYDFNGSGNISLTSLPTMGPQDFSISGWIKTNNLTLRKGIACWGQDSPWNSSYFYITDNGYLKFDFAYNGGPQSPIFVADNNWHSVLVTCTSGLIQLYLDGAATGTALTMTPNISGSNKSIGANIDNSGSNNFIGVLDDIGIWNRALTQQEITNLYTSSVPVSCLPAYVPTSGLVGYWPFCGNVNDESGNGNNGTVSGATLVSDRFGNANKAYNFDGSSNYISFPSGSSSSLNIISDLSLSFWIKSSTIQNNGIISFGDNTGGSGGYNVAHLSATNVNDVSFVSNNPSNSWLQTNATFNDNIWNNFVIAQKADTVRIYKNNSIVFTQTGYSYPLSYAGNRVIGTGSQLAYFFDGQIDDIGIWNRALTPQEITNLYTSTVPPTAAVLSGDATICAGASTNLSVAVTGGTAPYTVTVTDGTNNYSATGASPVSIPVSPTATSTYSIVSVTGGGTGTGNTGTAIVTVIDATISASDSVICAGETVTLSVPQGGS